MKSRLLVLSALFLFLTSFTNKNDLTRDYKRKPDLFQIGYFTVNGQEYDAYGSAPGGGSVYKLYKTDNNQNDVSLVYSWTGTYTSAHLIDVNFRLTSGGALLHFAGSCWY
ncbi:hypothetical protein [Mucilaginibacter sp. OK268]|jgi:hypothetical protein|uniref:hypothetical protein n=1 Tax=Mucilaginibacter sp. OK268 TaxID=1881048 RepID=UPI000B8A12EC|nr:hypothetical protein [Mucilaginibacter sp. OK268]